MNRQQIKHRVGGYRHSCTLSSQLLGAAAPSNNMGIEVLSLTQ